MAGNRFLFFSSVRVLTPEIATGRILQQWIFESLQWLIFIYIQPFDKSKVSHRRGGAYLISTTITFLKMTSGIIFCLSEAQSVEMFEFLTRN